MGYNPQESLENTINTMGTLLGYTQLSQNNNSSSFVDKNFTPVTHETT